MSGPQNASQDRGASPGVTQGDRRGPTSREGVKRRAWTDRDLELLAWWWGNLSLQSIAQRLGRSPKGVFQRASKLRLNARRAMGTISEVADAMGVDRDTLRRILKSAAVPTRAAPRDPSYKGASRGRGFRQRLVDRDEARLAVEGYLAGETLLAAARRLGTNDNWLKRRLVAAGVHVAVYGHRYSDETIQAAIAGYGVRS